MMLRCLATALAVALPSSLADAHSETAEPFMTAGQGVAGPFRNWGGVPLRRSGAGVIYAPAHLTPAPVENGRGRARPASAPEEESHPKPAALDADPAVIFRDLYAFPNPAKGVNPTIRLQAGAADSATLKIFDVAGREVYSSGMGSPKVLDDGNGKGPRWTYEHVWSVGRTGSGVYLFLAIVRAKGQRNIVQTQRVAVIR